VGLFISGESPYGMADLIGNVWEWTASAWGSENWNKPDYRYPYVADDGREDPEGNRNWRIIRGASWANEIKRARCAYRSRYYPDLDHINIGFRVVAFPGGF
jgi:iron(II)-dependent oxidoreductase